jgi:hypothetical protein
MENLDFVFVKKEFLLPTHQKFSTPHFALCVADELSLEAVGDCRLLFVPAGFEDLSQTSHWIHFSYMKILKRTM